MVKLIALKEIVENGKVIGFTIKIDGQKGTKDIKTEAIINVVKSGQAVAPNLGFVNGQLRIIADPKSVSSETSKNTGKTKTTMTSKSEPQHVQNKPSVQNNKPEPVKVIQNPVSQGISNSNPSGKSDSERIRELTKILNEARRVYEQGEDEIMSNFEYDKLYDELLALERVTGIVLSDSPTHNVGYEVVSKLPKETHASPMLSLDKTKDRQTLVDWLQGKDGVLSWKLDGLTVVLTYNNGKLEKAVTRGNGTVGELVTANARQFKNIPHQIPFTGRLVVRGEATIGYKTFNAINASLPAGVEQYKNPRNLCSGSVRQLDSSVTASRNVKWFAFELVEADGITLPNNIDEQFKLLKSFGFQCVDYIVVSPNLTDKNYLLNAINFFEKHIESNDVPSDGLVLAYRDKKFGLSLGRTAKFYRHSIAFKWKDEEAMSRLIDIEWQVGRTGVITPVAVFEPVNLEGSTVERASLHNISVMMDVLGRPYVGQRIKIYKANMIIPQISWGEKVDG